MTKAMVDLNAKIEALKKREAEIKAQLAETSAKEKTGENAIEFIREEGGHYCARIDDLEIKVWPIGYEINRYDEVFESPCDYETPGCREGRTDGECPCPYQLSCGNHQVASDYVNGGFSSLDDVITTVRKKLARYYREPAASRFANETWEFSDPSKRTK